jgi:hypothetical protein
MVLISTTNRYLSNDAKADGRLISEARSVMVGGCNLKATRWRSTTMRERAKVFVFTHPGGEGTTASEANTQEMLNDWLAETEGEIVRITQSESARANDSAHVTVCVWYVPAKSAK